MRHLNWSVMIGVAGSAFYAFATLLAVGINISSIAIAKSMSDNEYKFLEKNIEAEYRAAKTRCTSLSGNANKQCVAGAEIEKKKAEDALEVNRKQEISAQSAPRIAKADSEYLVAMQHCNSKTGDDKILCERSAKIVRNKEINNAKRLMQMEIPEVELLQDDNQSDLNSMKMIEQLPSSFSKSRYM